VVRARVSGPINITDDIYDASRVSITIHVKMLVFDE